jgi:hypothetical protein
MYKLNFEKIKESSDDFKGKNWYEKKDIINGIYHSKNDISMELDNARSIVYCINMLENESKWKYLPILYIDEGVDNHMTQILYMLKESFTDSSIGFTGWKSFSKEYLIDLYEKQGRIYIDDWPNGKQFISEFPDKINRFIECYCDEMI